MSLLKGCLSDVPPALIPYLIAFVGTIGNIASDTANIIVPPLAALLYIGAGKHPVVGMICGYAGANAGFTANLMVAVQIPCFRVLQTTRSKAFYRTQPSR